MPEEYWYLLAKKLNGNASHAELLQLQQYLQQDADFALQVKNIEALWSEIPDTPSGFDAERAYTKHVKRLNNIGEFESPDSTKHIGSLFKWYSHRKAIAAVAAAVSVLMLAAIFWPAKITTAPAPVAVTETIQTKPGSKSTITLPDGSEVKLNAGTELRYNEDFGEEKREIWLVGEAYFVVRENKQKPFIVHTRDYDVRVTGTVFNVRAYQEDPESETALVKGGVDIIMHNRREVYKLKPNEKFSHNRAQTEAISNSSGTIKELAPLVVPMITHAQLQAPVETAWINNNLIFQSETFASIAHKMSNWYGVDIRITDEALSQEIMSGYFTTETLSEALDILRFTTPFQHEMTKNSVIISP